MHPVPRSGEHQSEPAIKRKIGPRMAENGVKPNLCMPRLWRGVRFTLFPPCKNSPFSHLSTRRHDEHKIDGGLTEWENARYTASRGRGLASPTLISLIYIIR